MPHPSVQCSDCPTSVWRKLCEEDASCTIFQTPDWQHAAADYLGARRRPLLFEWDGGRAVLPLVERRGRLFRHWTSPLGTYCAPVGDTPPPPALKGIRQRLAGRNVDVFGSPYARGRLEMGNPVLNYTHSLDLTKVDPGNPERKWSEGHRYNCRAGTKAGVEIHRAASNDELVEYVALYHRGLPQLKVKAAIRYEWPLFEAFWRNLAESDAMRLWLAGYRGGVIAGTIVFYFQRHAVNWSNAFDRNSRRVYPNQVLFKTVIADAARRGFAWFDFNPSHGLAGVERFKKDFGCDRLEFHGFRQHGRLFRAWRRLADLRHSQAQRTATTPGTTAV